MEYINTVQASKKWNITTNRITILAKAGRIEGAIQIGTRWLIPKDAPKPVDGRTKAAKKNIAVAPPFRFYLYDSRPSDEFNPPLSEDEIRLKNAFFAFLACDFAKAEKLLSDMPLASMNQYNRIYALFASCMIDTMSGKTEDFIDKYNKLTSELQADFPRKKELSFLPHEIDGILGATGFYINDFRIDPAYSYHESFVPHLTYLSTISLLFSSRTFREQDLVPYELACAFVDKTTYLADAQTIHFYLGIIYGLMNKREEMTLHIKKALQLGMTYDLYWLPALVLFYYNNIIEPILRTFPKDYYEKITALSEDVHKRFAAFTEKTSRNSFFNILLSSEYLYIFYAVQGYTNKEVADLLDTTESYVSNKYSKIYQTLNVFNKKELVEYYSRCISSEI